ncbi:hypothetical protein NTG1052_50105 [Candidatus Nitrotoga sp. 1052]|nr:hypothetical protein NTG1052_50105 [Candidatus Nitrotoga sp. 1052]
MLDGALEIKFPANIMAQKNFDSQFARQMHVISGAFIFTG